MASNSSNDPGLYASLFKNALNVDPPKPVWWAYVPETLPLEEQRNIMISIWQAEGRHLPDVFKMLQRENIPGDIIEFGVSKGKSLNHILSICDEIGLKRQTYGFDSFEGLPEPSAFDPTDRNWTQGSYKADYAEVKKILKAATRPHLHLEKGWFCNTLPQYKDRIKTIAFCRIDCDLYESTVDCLDFLTGKLANGAVLYFDDWIHYDHTLGETRAFFEWNEKVKQYYRFEYITAYCVGSMIFRVWHR